MNITLLQNTQSCKKLDPHIGAGQTTSKPLACRIMNWLSLSSTLSVIMFCGSPGGTLDITITSCLSTRPFTGAMWTLLGAVPRSLRALLVLWSPRSPQLILPCQDSPAFATPFCSLYQMTVWTAQPAKGKARHSECFLFSCFESFHLHLDVSCLHCTRTYKTKVQVS